MSETRNISPLLDGFTVGAPISEHNGVCCCPAIKDDSDKKYIVKIITIPANQTQLDALLLAGAYTDPADAMDYFRKISEDILKEAEQLKDLSKLEGFLPYDGWQMEPITRRRLGYEVYLVGSYKRSLDKYIRKHAVTHLEAINLGLDLCTALSVCRQSGYLYVDLKPSNIYVSDKKEYRIGDLGFISMDTLRYATLPDRYFSCYTPPELFDPMSEMNLTVDTYAVGMILYQLYNDGQLPFTGKAPETELPVPVNADYEIAEIIMKSIHPDPGLRWQDPKDLGKALASYMQRNSVNDVPITPFVPLDVKPEDIVKVSKKKEVASVVPSGPVTEDIPENHTDESSIVIEDRNPDTEEAESPKAESPIQSEEVPLVENQDPEVTDFAEESPVEPQEDVPEATQMTESTEDTEPAAAEDHPELSEEVTKILSKADDLISHEIPSEVLFPEHVEEDPFAFVYDDAEDSGDIENSDQELLEDEEEKPAKQKHKKHFLDQTRKKKIKKFFRSLFALVLLGCLSVAGYWYYLNVFLQSIEGISVSGSQNEITVLVDTKVEESQLTVHCSDHYGKVHTQQVIGGKATITNLIPSTMYTIEVKMEGFHKLTGKTSEVFTTDATTQILSFTSTGGPEDGSVILNFTVDGEEPDFWNILYTAEGEDEKRETVTGHTATITGLTVGKTYTFRIDGGKNFDLGGETTLQLLASKLILADNLLVTTDTGSDITVSWKTPGDVVVDSWKVRCYDGYGYEEMITVTENKAVFTDIDSTESYVVEITASGMTQPVRVNISADPINISEIVMDESNRTDLKLSWEYTGSAPEGGWLVIYTVDGSGSQILKCDKAFANISPLVPGAKYDISVQAADDRTIFNNRIAYQSEPAEPYTENTVVLEDISFDLLKTPEETGWRCDNIDSTAYTTSFASGESASIAMRSTSTFYLPGSELKVLFVFRDPYGNVLPEHMVLATHYWKNLWLGGDVKNGELDIPKLPETPGKYILDLYFNGCSVTSFDITITG